jgi:hypothetical protein
MKKRIQLLTVAVAFIAALCFITHEPPDAVAGDAYVAALQTIKTNASTTVPVALSATTKYFKVATFIGNNSTSRDANTGTVYIGVTTNNNAQPITITSGSMVVVEAPQGSWYNLADWYLDVATANDGVVIIYTQ